MSTLYIRLPSRAAADAAAHWVTLSCPYALTQGDTVSSEGTAPLADLADQIARAQRVVLLVAASDVTLLRIQVPPLSPARLKAALPNLLEDQLMSDPAESVFVPGPSSAGLRTVAVVNRGWLEILAHTISAYGARNIAALPAQACLPFEAGIVNAAALAPDGEIDLTLRLAEHQGIGLSIQPEQAESAEREVIEALCAMVPVQPISLYVAQSRVRHYQEVAAGMLALDQRVTVHADQWSRWIAGSQQAVGQALNLFAALTGAGSPAFEWRPWRWPAALLILLLLVNIIGLNVDWWRKKRESDTLRTSMVQIYKAAFPREQVIVDPLAQMKQKIAAAQRISGQPAADDLLALAANFGAAWQSAVGTPPEASLTGMDYREHALIVHTKPGVVVPQDALRLALGERHLAMTQTPAQAGANAWQIGSAK